jgi:hypothetical protein
VGRWQDLKVRTPTPRVSLEGQWTVEPDDGRAARALALDAPVVVAEGPAAGPGEGTAGSVDIQRDDPTELHVQVNATRPALLVVRDAGDVHWSAQVDGADARTLRANVFQRAVLVPAGTHTVQMRYQPPGLWRGAIIGMAGWLGWLAWTIRRRRAR